MDAAVHCGTCSTGTLTVAGTLILTIQEGFNFMHLFLQSTISKIVRPFISEKSKLHLRSRSGGLHMTLARDPTRDILNQIVRLKSIPD